MVTTIPTFISRDILKNQNHDEENTRSRSFCDVKKSFISQVFLKDESQRDNERCAAVVNLNTFGIITS